MTARRANHGSNRIDLHSGPAGSGVRRILGEDAFRETIAIERKRTERSKEPFLLMLFEAVDHPDAQDSSKRLNRVAAALMPTIRETDVAGWYKDHAVFGVVYTGLPANDSSSMAGMILHRVSAVLQADLTIGPLNQIRISYYLFPDDWDEDQLGSSRDFTLYPDLKVRAEGKRLAFMVKHGIDFVVSALILILISPLLLLIALAIKATSRGPVLFKQKRIAQFGKHFTMLKFRSMYADTDHHAHKEYATKFINQQAELQSLNGNGDGVYKLTNDKRITKIGRILRKTSLDELPQFINVLKGEMSLIGPRPAIPYEFSVYQTWHRRRVLEVKPGISGLWQVTSRSRAKFDEMVRLDLRYAKTWTLWLDLKIFLLTPFAMIRGDGAH